MRRAWLKLRMESIGSDLDGVAGRGGVHHLAVADVHADVADRAVEEQQVAGLEVARADTGLPIGDCMRLECGRLMPAAA